MLFLYFAGKTWGTMEQIVKSTGAISKSRKRKSNFEYYSQKVSKSIEDLVVCCLNEEFKQKCLEALEVNSGAEVSGKLQRMLIESKEKQGKRISKSVKSKPRS